MSEIQLQAHICSKCLDDHAKSRTCDRELEARVAQNRADIIEDYETLIGRCATLEARVDELEDEWPPQYDENVAGYEAIQELKKRVAALEAAVAKLGNTVQHLYAWQNEALDDWEQLMLDRAKGRREP